VGYEYHAGVFVPCAPFGKGNNNGYFMEVCTDCATPRNSGIPIKGGLKLKNLDLGDITANALGGAEITLLWENANPSTYGSGSITLASGDYDLLIIECGCPDIKETYQSTIVKKGHTGILIDTLKVGLYGVTSLVVVSRSFSANENSATVTVSTATEIAGTTERKNYLVPISIYGVKI
jgi:hypothetical protein